MSKQAMISVIVPVYNVEKYIGQCINSLLQQDYPEVEFIMINDGSLDRSSEIIKGYNDPRIRLYNTENRGLAAARNYGIDRANGKYVMFVDGDDYVASNFCSAAYNSMKENDADLVLFNYFIEKPNGRIKKGNKIKTEGLITFEEALQFGGCEAWSKLYKKDLFNNIRYPEGRVYEDVATTYKIESIAKRISIIDECLYFHVYRNNSITHEFSIVFRRDGLISALERDTDLKEKGCLPDTIRKELVYYAIRYIMSAEKSEDPIYQKAEQILRESNLDIYGLPIYRALGLILWKISPNLFNALRKKMKKYKKTDLRIFTCVI